MAHSKGHGVMAHEKNDSDIADRVRPLYVRKLDRPRRLRHQLRLEA